MIRVILFEDNKSFRQSLGLYLACSNELFLAGSFPDVTQALANIRKYKPDVILMDIQMPGESGLEALKKIKAVNPETKVLMQTVFEDDYRIFTAVCNGANGYVLKSHNPDDILRAVVEVYHGGACMSPSIAAKVMQMFKNQFVQSQTEYIDLTEREKEVLGCMVKGMSYKMIADFCALSFHTVHWHVKNIYEKLHVNSAPEAVAKAIEGRLV